MTIEEKTVLTRDQFIMWNGTLVLTKYHPSFVLALPGKINTIQLLSGSKESRIYNASVRWIEPLHVNYKYLQNNTQLDQWNIIYYNKHIYTIAMNAITYYFVKYVHQSVAGNDHDLCTHLLYKVINFFQIKKLQEKDINCTGQSKGPKSFSWVEALSLCHSINATLPEFYSRKEQEEFIAILKSADIFPIEAVYIGLYRIPKVSTNCLTLQNSSCLMKVNFLNLVASFF